MSRLPLPFCSLIALVVALSSSYAQVAIRGTVTDAASGLPIEFATVMLKAASDSSLIAGTTTDLEGAFEVTTDLQPEALLLELSFIGFETSYLAGTSFAERPNTISTAKSIELGQLQLAEAGKLLDEVVVRAERSQTTFTLDKRIFNVGKDLASTGANALEVLDNVPSVSVDIDGTVSLRGSQGVQILINGKPSVLTSEGNNALSTLTADMIERVEVITNPSAKYEAEGTGGILNIVIKKDERRGLNGAISLNGGYPANHSLGLSLNRRTERFNLFSQLGVGYREQPTDVVNENRNLETLTLVRSVGEEARNELFYNLVLGTDYTPSERDIITLSGNFAYEVEDQPSSFEFTRSRDPLNSIVDRWRRTEDTEATNPKYQFDLQWARDFKKGSASAEAAPVAGERRKDKREHQLVTSLTGSLFSKDQSSVFANITLEGNIDQADRQQTRTDFGHVETTAKIDYTRPVGEEALVEAGAQFVANDVSNDFAVANELNGSFVGDPALTDIFDWNQRVLAGYLTAAEQFGDLGVKAGLRIEYTDLTTLLRSDGQDNDQQYINYFPSAAASYKVSDAVSLQTSYSRRIDRPRLWDLNPFFNIRNNFAYRVGNPDLGPELTDSYEATAIFIVGEASLNAGAYHRRTTELVERVTTFTDDSAITKPFNVGTQNTTGLELNGKYTPSKALTLRADLNASAFVREGAFGDQRFDFDGRQWSGRLSAKLRLPFELEAELTGRYRSSFKTFQGEVSEQAWLDLGIRQPLLGGKGSLNLSVRDLFASRVRENFVFQDSFETYSFGQRGRFVTLGLSYGFGKGDTMEYLGQRRR